MTQQRIKSVAIALAIGLGPLSYLYTYKDLKQLFWVSLGTSIVFWWTLIIPLMSYIIAIVVASIRPRAYYLNYSNEVKA